jgi:NADPH-dependent curcumin reductase CurA
VEGHSEFISMSSLGMVAWTAYFGAFEVAKIKKEHTVVVSGAAGWVFHPCFFLGSYMHR